MASILVATDADEIHDEVEAALASSEVTVHRVRSGRAVRRAVIELDPDLVVIDLQIGSMGGIAACMDLRLEESGDRLEPQNVLLLLDREADVFLARQSGADGWLVKPIDAGRLARAAETLIAGGSWHDGTPVDSAV